MKYKTIVIDDERLARAEMRRLLSEFGEINIVGEAENLSEAVELIEKENRISFFSTSNYRTKTASI